MPLFIVNALPKVLSLSFFAFLIFLAGLLSLTIAAVLVVRSNAPRFVWTVVLGAASMIVLYNLSPLAPTVITANDAGPNDQPPTIWSNFFCNSWGNNGWCRVPSTLSVYARDPQYYVLTKFSVYRTNDGTTFTCNPWVPECDLWQGEGMWMFNYTVTSSSGLSASGSTTTKVDATAPDVSIVVPRPTGANGWFTTSPVVVSVSGSDSLSGLADAWLSMDGGDTRQSSVMSLASDGEYLLSYGADDVAGNIAYYIVGRYSFPGIPVNIDTTPPTIKPSVSGTSGTNGWYVSAVDISATATDAGSGVQGNVEVSLDGGTTWTNLPITLADGNHSLDFRAYDNAGNLSTSSLTVNVDTTPPSLTSSTAGTSGNAGWYVSSATTSVSSSDALSGVDHIEYNQNDAGWQDGSSIISNDGVNTISIRAYDVAGNVASGSVSVKVDTILPTSLYTGHTGDEVVAGTVKLSGTSSDTTSGLQSAEVSIDGGATWNAATLSGGLWSYDWDTTVLQNGTYAIKMRAMDMAGNRENPIPLTLVVDNSPPHVKITDWWWIWQSGEYKVSENSFAISEIKVTISDPEGRWPSTVLAYDPSETSSTVTWDRRFPGGVVAPSGNYNVTIKACDIYGNCASDQGQIKIPFIAPVPPTATPSPIPSPMPSVSPTPASTITAIPLPTNVQPVATQSVLVAEPVSRPPTVAGRKGHTLPILAVVSFIALLWVLSSASLADPRPKAILEIAKTISVRAK
jgi:Big-like domain-containing protein